MNLNILLFATIPFSSLLTSSILQEELDGMPTDIESILLMAPNEDIQNPEPVKVISPIQDPEDVSNEEPSLEIDLKIVPEEPASESAPDESEKPKKKRAKKPKAPKEKKIDVSDQEGHLVNFPNVSMYELVKFISRVAKVNFIGDQSLLGFEVSFISGRPIMSGELVKIVLRMMEQNDLRVEYHDGSYFFKEKDGSVAKGEDPSPSITVASLPQEVKRDGKYYVYKLQFHQGDEILNALKLIPPEFRLDDLGATIGSMQWIKSTNSLFFSGPPTAIEEVCSLIERLDTELKQVFIEVLVIETNIHNSLDFGVQWSASSKYKDRIGFGAGSLYPTIEAPTFAQTMQSVGEKITPEGLKQLPIGNGFDLGIIGDIIFHKGRSFLSLGSLISALQTEGDCKIVLNQKIITQENKNSRIFVGDNLPFAGSVVQTVGSGQQTTANIEYRDVGVSLDITPLLGDSDIISLDIHEEITEALDHPVHRSNQLSGIKTSKTNMATSAHVPNGHFLILSGMTRNVETKEKKGPPFIGAIPFVGGLFNKHESKHQKSNILIFVRPHIISSRDTYIELSNDLREEVS